MTAAEVLLTALLRQSVQPQPDDDCDACAAMDAHAAVVRRLVPLAAGANQCPWHSGFDDGWRTAAAIVEGALS
jgi:hypothetical protein